jgi:hypothetical protein
VQCWYRSEPSCMHAAVYEGRARIPAEWRVRQAGRAGGTHAHWWKWNTDCSSLLAGSIE